jgi:DNA-binding PadR family transcriptional regulator
MEQPADSSPLSIPVYQILLSLSDRALHGYAILQDIKERTDGEVQLAAGTLYAAIARLERDGLIEELADPPDGDEADPRRRYYRISDAGLEAARAEARRLRRFADMAEAKRLLDEPASTRGGGRE